ncbi:class IIb bacteriocin, lactobin A/cerein 7B family [Ferrimonas balearica]|uniref:class IIb bacteriocin, lactobin A/cerein 7B family n=1 Tax=Ferrimonas balearica TaxID=44012 RepID=UPI003CCFE49F
MIGVEVTVKKLTESELHSVNGGFVPFAIQAAVYIAGQGFAIYGTYNTAKFIQQWRMK